MARQSPELRRSLQKLRRDLVHTTPAVIKNAMISEVEGCAADLVELQKSVAPVDEDANHGAPPGTLRDSHRYVQSEGGLRATVIAGGQGFAPYAVHVEQGTEHAPPHSWFWPSYRLLKPTIKRRLSKALTKVIKYLNANQRA